MTAVAAVAGFYGEGIRREQRCFIQYYSRLFFVSPPSLFLVTLVYGSLVVRVRLKEILIGRRGVLWDWSVVTLMKAYHAAKGPNKCSRCVTMNITAAEKQ